MTRRSYIQIDGKLIDKAEYYGDNSRTPQQGFFIPDIEPFVSSVDGSVVSSRSVLREHNRKHDVVQYAEFSPEYIEKKVQERMLRLNGQTKEDKQHRIELLKNAIDNQRR